MAYIFFFLNQRCYYVIIVSPDTTAASSAIALLRENFRSFSSISSSLVCFLFTKVFIYYLLFFGISPRSCLVLISFDMSLLFLIPIASDLTDRDNELREAVDRIRRSVKDNLRLLVIHLLSLSTQDPRRTSPPWSINLLSASQQRLWW